MPNNQRRKKDRARLTWSSKPRRAPNPKGIDFSKIRDNLTYEKPIALVSAGKTHYVMVHPRLLNKSARIGVVFPVGHPGTPATGATAFEIPSSQFNDWIEWAKKVKQAPWGGKKPRKDGKLGVAVVLPGI